MQPTQDDLPRFAIPDRLAFDSDAAGRPLIVINSPKGHAVISLFGAQVLRFQPAVQGADVLFLSDKARYQSGKAIRGGIPICWPWFGPDPADLGRPAHGFARITTWRLLDASTDDQDAVTITLGLPMDAIADSDWPHHATLRLTVTVGSTLSLRLTTTNLGATSISFTEALHSYFTVGDIRQVRIPALSGVHYIDQLAADTHHVQEGPLTLQAPVDRIFTDAPDKLEIEDPTLKRTLRMNTSGARDIVVWNPWVEGAAEMTDLDDADYQRMVCVEAANTGANAITLAPGERHSLCLICHEL